jgi:hypothetical protein
MLLNEKFFLSIKDNEGTDLSLKQTHFIFFTQSILLFWKQKQTILLRNNCMKIGKRTFEIKGYQY